jgi:hypothetical protein
MPDSRFRNSAVPNSDFDVVTGPPAAPAINPTKLPARDRDEDLPPPPSRTPAPDARVGEYR